jgi:hypothetical protein
MPDRKMGSASNPISTLPKRFACGELVILEESATLDAGSCRGLAVRRALSTHAVPILFVALALFGIGALPKHLRGISRMAHLGIQTRPCWCRLRPARLWQAVSRTRTIRLQPHPYPLGRQRRASLTGGTHMLGQERLDAVGTEPAPVHVGEQCARSRREELLLDVHTLLIPAEQGPDCEAMPEVVHARSGAITKAPQTDVFDEWRD